MDKRAIELSLNFIVILIISIAVLAFGIRFIYKLSSSAISLQEMTTGEINKRMSDLTCEGSERVCIGNDRTTIERKNFGIFGLKIINILESQDFSIDVRPSNPIGYKKDKSQIIGPGLITKFQESVTVRENEDKKVGIAVEVPSNAESGTYILNVEVKTQDGNLYVPMQKIYVEVP